MGIFGSSNKKSLLKKAKELGLNLDPNMSEFDIKAEINKREEELKTPPTEQPSQQRGEY